MQRSKDIVQKPKWSTTASHPLYLSHSGSSSLALPPPALRRWLCVCVCACVGKTGKLLHQRTDRSVQVCSACVAWCVACVCSAPVRYEHRHSLCAHRSNYAGNMRALHAHNVGSGLRATGMFMSIRACAKRKLICGCWNGGDGRRSPPSVSMLNGILTVSRTMFAFAGRPVRVFCRLPGIRFRFVSSTSSISLAVFPLNCCGAYAGSVV